MSHARRLKGDTDKPEAYLRENGKRIYLGTGSHVREDLRPTLGYRMDLPLCRSWNMPMWPWRDLLMFGRPYSGSRLPEGGPVIELANRNPDEDRGSISRGRH